MHKRFPAIRICAFLLLSTFYKRGINTMDLRQLEYIVAIAEKGNISKAADSLFITQSGLNQQLIKLEKELGIQLNFQLLYLKGNGGLGKAQHLRSPCEASQLCGVDKGGQIFAVHKYLCGLPFSAFSSLYEYESKNSMHIIIIINFTD